MPTPEDLTEALRVLGMLAGQLGEYRDMLVQSGFHRHEAQELVRDYQDHVLETGDE